MSALNESPSDKVGGDETMHEAFPQECENRDGTSLRLEHVHRKPDCYEFRDI